MKNFYPVILAGGRGTRFWPLSRRRRAKQVLALDGKRTMIQHTVARLKPLAAEKSFWVITNDDLNLSSRASACSRSSPNRSDATPRLPSGWRRLFWRGSIRMPSSACFRPIT